MSLLKVRALGLYVLSFGAGRGTLFAAPLLLANAMPIQDYGRVEGAQAIASIAANALAFGTTGIIPLVMVGHTATVSLVTITKHHLGIVLACLLAMSGMLLWHAPTTWVLAALLTATTAMQAFSSTCLKTEGRSEASVLLDAGLFALMALAAVWARFAAPHHALQWVAGAASVYLLALVIPHWRNLSRSPAPVTARHWMSAMSMGWPLMMVGIVSLLATTSGRLGMSLMAEPSVVATYAVLSRAAALPIVAHQLILIARFRQVFTLDNSAVERTAYRIVLLVGLSSLALWTLAPTLGFMLGPAFEAARLAHQQSSGLILAQAVLWSAIALNDLITSRHQASRAVLPTNSVVLGAAILLGWLHLRSNGMSLDEFVLTHSVVMLCFYVAQAASMRAQGMTFYRLWGSSVAGYLLMCTLAMACPL